MLDNVKLIKYNIDKEKNLRIEILKKQEVLI